jgi:hypothetical protein
VDCVAEAFPEVWIAGDCHDCWLCGFCFFCRVVLGAVGEGTVLFLVGWWLD